jgi:sporulation protein YlmC with PRC-barrel domain
LSVKVQRKFVPREKLLGMQVIDPQGKIVGKIKDIAFSIGEGEIALVVETKAGAEMQVLWKDVKSAEDVVLLEKTVEIPAPPAPQTTICLNCKATIPAKARFCPKCGAKVA